MCVESPSRQLSRAGALKLLWGSALLFRTGSGKTLAFALPYLSMSRSK